MMLVIFRKIVCFVQVFVLSFTSVILPSPIYAQSISQPPLTLPAIGEMVNISKIYTPVLIKGLTMDQSDPLKFEFLMDQGDSDLQGEDLKSESYKLVKYFMASMTVPEQDLWVNLSPYEKDRIIPDSLGQTEMGRDLLSQDYILKQLTATLMSPQGETGKIFWEKIYSQAEKAGISNIPVDTFNKIWIVPQTGYFYEHNNSVLITDAKLKVMLEEDFVAAQKTMGAQNYGLDSRDGVINELSSPNVSIGDPLSSEDKSKNKNGFPTKALGNDNLVAMTEETNDVKHIIRSVIIPIIEQEVNEGEHFAPLRQVYNAMLLAVWFKKRIKGHLLSEVYVDQRKTSGIDFNDPNANEAIWKQYVETFKSGVADTIQDEYDPATQSMIPKKYFVGGTTPFDPNNVVANRASLADIGKRPYVLRIEMGNNSAMLNAWRVLLVLSFLNISAPVLGAMNLNVIPIVEQLNSLSWIYSTKGVGVDEWKTDTLPDGRLVHQNGTAQIIGMNKDGEVFTSSDSTISFVFKGIKPEKILLAAKNFFNGIPLKREKTAIDLMTISVNGVAYDKVTFIQFLPEDVVMTRTQEGTNVIVLPKGSLIIGRWDTSKGFLVIGPNGEIIKDLTGQEYFYNFNTNTIVKSNRAMLTKEEAMSQVDDFLAGPNSLFLREIGGGKPLVLELAKEIAAELLLELDGKPMDYEIFDTKLKKKEITMTVDESKREFYRQMKEQERGEIELREVDLEKLDYTSQFPPGGGLSFLYVVRLRIKEEAKRPTLDKASLTQRTMPERHEGGVNLRSDQADIQIQTDDNGFKFPKYDPTMPMMPLQRLTPIILDLKFITIADVAMKLGLAFPEKDSSDHVIYPQEKAKEQEQLSVL